MAMEKALAPSVVRPPWASRRAWKTRTTVPRKAITGGLNSTAPRPVPVGWEELPVTLGSLIADRTNVNAPAAASRSLFSGLFWDSRMTARAP